MSLINKRLKPSSPLFAILFLQAASYIIVIFNISIIRQILLFIYITFLPGYLIIKLLRFSFEPLEALIFSAGFSVAFLMLIGLVLNELGFIAGFSQPLSTIPLLIVLNNVILAIAFLAYLRSTFSDTFCLSSGVVKWIVPLSVPLILSIVGAILVNLYNNNFLLVLMILAVSLLAIFLTLKNKVPSIAHMFAVFIIGASLLFHSLLVSKYLITFGSDVMVEHFVFKHTLDNGFWNCAPPAYWDIGTERLNGMLSITILPTVYSNLLNLDSTWVLKLVFPLIFAFVPLCLYQLWRKTYGEKWAFFSAFFFVATATFYTELLGLNRQMIAEFFFALLIFILLNNKMNRLQKIFSFFIFGYSLVVSHYGVAEIFLFLIVFALICLLLFKRRSGSLTVSMVVLFFIIMFAWYIFTSNASVFESLLNFGEYVYQQLGEFFKLESRGETVLRGLGLESPPTIWNAISRFFAYATEFLIVVGFLSILFRRENINLSIENITLIFEAMGFLVALIIVPGLANTMNMTRFYHVLLFFLAPLCILGARGIVKIVRQMKKEVYVSFLLIFILVPYFLFQSGFVYEITGSQSWSLPLSMYRLGIRLHAGFGFVTESEVIGAQWLSRNSIVRNSTLFANFYIFSALVGYGNVIEIKRLTNNSIPKEDSFIYLGTLNTVYELVIDYEAWNTTDILRSNFIFSDKVYSNGNCEIYKVGP